MFPIRDSVPTRTAPVVNWAIVAGNGWAFYRELTLGPGLEKFLFRWGVVPARYAGPHALASLGAKAYFVPFFSSMFLHGSWMHILSNMWMLLIFGDAIEDRLGHFRYLFFYLLAGLAAGLTQLRFAWGSPMPTIGASGAIAGVMGAYFVLYPWARVSCLVPIFIFIQTIDVPAFLFLGLWLWSQIYSANIALASAGKVGGIAWWAHIGGFAAGIAWLAFLLPRGRTRRAAA